MNTIDRFVKRLKKIGIDVELAGNYPWVYLAKVNGVPVRDKLHSYHGFTVFIEPVNRDEQAVFTDIRLVFAKIREIIEKN